MLRYAATAARAMTVHSRPLRRLMGEQLRVRCDAARCIPGVCDQAVACPIGVGLAPDRNGALPRVQTALPTNWTRWSQVVRKDTRGIRAPRDRVDLLDL